MPLLLFRVVAGVLAALAVTAMQSQLLSHLFGQAVAAVSAAIGS